MSAVSKGYLTIPSELVRFEGFSVRTRDSTDQSWSDVVTDWSYYEPITASTVLDIDLSATLAALALPRDSRLSAFIQWSSDGTSMRGASEPVELLGGETTLKALIGPGLIRQTLRLVCVIVLASLPEKSISALAPSAPGAQLWEDGVTVELEGVAPRMPLVAQPFSHQFPNSTHAMWWLKIVDEHADLNVRADSVFWMWLNSENTMISDLLAGRTTELGGLSAHFMWLDQQRQLVLFAIRRGDLELNADYPAGSLGQTLVEAVRAVSDDLGSLRTEWETSPNDLEAAIQAAFGGISA